MKIGLYEVALDSEMESALRKLNEDEYLIEIKEIDSSDTDHIIIDYFDKYLLKQLGQYKDDEKIDIVNRLVNVINDTDNQRNPAVPRINILTFGDSNLLNSAMPI